MSSPIPPETIGPAVAREAELSGFIGSLVRFPKPISWYGSSPGSYPAPPESGTLAVFLGLDPDRNLDLDHNVWPCLVDGETDSLVEDYGQNIDALTGLFLIGGQRVKIDFIARDIELVHPEQL